MISKDISTDIEFNKVSDKAVILFTFLIAHLDKSGRFFAIPSILKGQVIPLRTNISEKCIPKLLQELEKVNAIRVYGENREYLTTKGFLNHNKPHPHEPESKIPDYKSKLK